MINLNQQVDITTFQFIINPGTKQPNRYILANHSFCSAGNNLDNLWIKSHVRSFMTPNYYLNKSLDRKHTALQAKQTQILAAHSIRLTKAYFIGL